jgi:predicted ATPase
MEGEGPQSRSLDFGALLREYRLAAGLSQEALAERARLSLHGISALERGYRRTPQRETLALLAGALALDDTQRKEFETAAARPSAPRRRAGSVTVGPWADAEATPLPFALTTFVGRQRELDEIAMLVRKYRFVTLTGAGGIGKTQTALHVATGTDGASDGAICFVGLAPIADPALVLVEIASALGVQELPNRPLLETIVAFLKNKSLLLVLDNCEHVVEQAATAADALLQRCPCVRILATSREPLRTAGERTYHLPSLNLSDASALFADRAQAADNRFELTAENAPAVGELCRRLDGIPLAIELAAARAKILSPKTLVEKLDDRFSVLAGGERLALPRQQTMRATIDWSYSLLSAPEQRLFERLSVFAGGCALTEVTAVCAGDDLLECDVLDLLSSLVDKSLVTVVDGVGEPYYVLLESFREYGSEKLRARDEHSIVARRHARAYRELVIRFNRSEQHSELVKLDTTPIVRNIRVALRWTLTERFDVPLGQQLASSCWRVFRYAEGARWMATAVDLISEQTPIILRAAICLQDAGIRGEARQFARELASAQQALECYRALADAEDSAARRHASQRVLGYDDDACGFVNAQSLIGHALLYLGRRAEAKILLEKNMVLARRLDAPERDFVIVYNLRLLALATEDIEAARSYLAEAMRIIKASSQLEPWHDIAAGPLLDLGECEFGAGNVELALQHTCKALDRLAAARENNRTVENVKSLALNFITFYLIALGRYDEAEEHARRALDLTRECSLYADMLWCLEQFAAVAALRRRSVTDEAARMNSAARLVGFADAGLADLGSARWPFAQPQYDRTLAELQRSLGRDRVSELMCEGAAMTEEQALSEALGR